MLPFVSPLRSARSQQIKQGLLALTSVHRHPGVHQQESCLVDQYLLPQWGSVELAKLQLRSEKRLGDNHLTLDELLLYEWLANHDALPLHRLTDHDTLPQPICGVGVERKCQWQ